MKIVVDALDIRTVDAAIRKLDDYTKSLDEKAKALCERLAQMGAMYAEWNFSGVLYAGDIDYHIDVQRGEGNTYYIIADGKTVLLLEFGAGVKHGYGHPKAQEFGMGPGTYPGQKHAFDPKGWWFRQGSQKIHSYGNAPGMPMYNAGKDLRNDILEAAREVFQS